LFFSPDKLSKHEVTIRALKLQHGNGVASGWKTYKLLENKPKKVCFNASDSFRLWTILLTQV